ncbi:MAG: hypothetical protein JXR94_04560 [Candidatus Hydrogenedentes bacterium]|nr:hypothetical protein [Candidatus Hydrogenedentota bacterium]
MSSSHGAEPVRLERAVIVADPEEPSFVQYGVEELAGYLKDMTGHEIPVVASGDRALGVRIVVGTKAAQGLFPEHLPDEALGEEGYVVRVTSEGRTACVCVAGTTPHGTKAALNVLMKAIRSEGASAFVPGTLNVAGKPALAKRGMHLNGWAIDYPYSFRSWREEDWQRYLDVLAYQGVNLFYLWPFIEIMPVPLSPEDTEYLQECRRVVDYAQRQHGMEVWLMQCTNRVARDRCGVVDPRLRPYWRPSQEDLDPGNAEHFQAIMASREAMYRIVDNADGVCNIDSDPGFCAGSPLSDYVKVLEGCRALLDEHNRHGKQAKLINWMLWGWGRAERMSMDGLVEHQRLTVQQIREALPEPWWLLCSQFGFLPPDQHQFLPVCREEKVLDKSVFFPYGIIEGEPSYPRTGLEIDRIRNTFENQIEHFPELAGAMGNVQTPLLQFPNVYYFTSAMFDAGYRNRSQQEVMLDLAGYLYPEHKQLVADCFLAMAEPDPVKVEALANLLDGVVREGRLGRGGLFGRKLFPDASIVAHSLVLQLRMRAAQERLAQSITATTPEGECERLLRDYFEAYLAWDTTHGWHRLWGWDQWPVSDARFVTVAEAMRASFGEEPELNACFERIVQALSAQYGEAAVREGCIAHWGK